LAENQEQAPAAPFEGNLAEVRDYEILGEVGRGGMGIVFRARHKLLDRQVAIKVKHREGSAERFLREARLLAQVRSPYVVGVHDFQILSSGHPLLVLEWVEGTDLQRLLNQHGGALREALVLTWMRQVCEGMIAAAEKGIIHRDLKPSNLLIDHQGRARIADFGLARDPFALSFLSQSGELMGTPYYMAPEQAEDPRAVDTRADVYSFGATFYHALTGRPPFEGSTGFTVLYKHKTEPLVSPRVHNYHLSGRTCELLERCLAKAPADRFSSFEEIHRLLEPGPGVLMPASAAENLKLAPHLARFQQRRLAYLAEQTAWNQDLDVYTLDGQILRIVRGDISAQQVEALVSSDTSYLAMAYGVSGALAEAGGEAVREQARRLAPVRPGRAAVTLAGKLPARMIFHGVTAGRVGGLLIRPSRELISEILTSCFYLADTYELRSMAIPLLGTGAQGFPRDVCLDTTFDFLARTFLGGLTGVQEVRVVLFKQD
jgi:serine/threonine protein kinase